MLRITKIGETASQTTLKVEGGIVSEWVPVLEAESLRWLGEKRKLVLDFSGVNFVDRLGVEALGRIRSQALQIINCPPILADLINGDPG